MGRLFTAFTKIMSNRHLNQEGVGLGLTISSNIAKALGGEITVSSQLRVGSTFILRIPWISHLGFRLSSNPISAKMRDSGDQVFTDLSDTLY